MTAGAPAAPVAGWRVAGPFLAGLAALVLGERALTGGGRAAAFGVAALALAVAWATAAARARHPAADRRAVLRRLWGQWTQASSGIALWGLSRAPEARAACAALWAPAPLLLTAAGVLLAGWGAASAAAGEWALAGMARAPRWEGARIARASRAAQIVWVTCVAFAALNFTASVWSRRIDLSYFRTTRVGEAVAERVRHLQAPLYVETFFPPGNEVALALEAYLAPLAAVSPTVVRASLDHAVDVERARALSVRANGTLVLTHEGHSATVPLGLDLEASRAVLRDLDARVLRAIAEATRVRPIVYVTYGHQERALSGRGGADDPRPGLGKLRLLVDKLGMQAKPLGLSEGLGQAVPGDAAAVASIGALAPMVAGEREAIAAYLRRGGRLLLAQDPDLAAPDDALTALVGMRVGRHLIAHDRYLVRFAQRRASPYDLVTTATGVHPVARGVQRFAGQAAVLVLGAGAVLPLGPAPDGAGPADVLRAMPGAWDDRIVNGRFDGPPETQAPHTLVAAWEQPVSAEGQAPGARPPPPARAVVMGDAEMLADGVLENPGNAALAGDALRWLVGEPPADEAAVNSERDVTLVQRRDRDAVWFWGVVFGMPAAVSLAGYQAGRRRRRPMRGATEEA